MTTNRFTMNRSFFVPLMLLASVGIIAGITCIVSTPKSLASTTATTAKTKTAYDPTATALAEIAKQKVGKHDWPQWGGWSGKNNTPDGKNIPIKWDVKKGTNIKWKVDLGSQTYGNAVIANGKVYIGTNNGAGYLKRYPPKIDLGCLICFEEKTGKFLWQHSSTKLAAGRVVDWPEQGICDAPYAEGDRLWYVTSRGEVVCLDANGFTDGKNNGPYKGEPNENKDEADVIWKFDMMAKLGTFQHNMCSCSVAVAGDILFVNSSNGVDASHANLPSPKAPSFFAMNKNTGKVLWTDNSPAQNILHGQWSSPTYAVLNGKPQVLFAGGDGWLRSFSPKGKNGKSVLYWKFDCNPKESKWVLGGRGTRNNVIATPVIYDSMVYIAVGQDPEHGEGMGHLYCIKPPKTTDGQDVSPFLAVDKNGKAVAHRRFQAVNAANGEKAIKNPKSAMLWHYGSWTKKEYDAKEFEQQMHRSCGTVAIKNDLLFISDFSGLLHCLNAKTGKGHWTYDMFAESWGTPLIVENKVYVGDADGDISIFPLTSDPKKALKKVDKEWKPALGEINVGNAVHTTPVVANNVLYIANKNRLFAIAPTKK